MPEPEDFVSIPQFNNELKRFVEKKIFPKDGDVLGFNEDNELVARAGSKWEMVEFPESSTSAGKIGQMAYKDGYLGIYVGDEEEDHQWGFIFLVTDYPPI